MASEKVDTVVLLDTQDCPGYTYEELPTPTSVRLISALRLELVDGLPLVDTTHGTMTAVLSFSLRTVDLATKPSYDCLSYTWGRPGRVFTSKAVHDSSEEYYSQRSAVLCDGKLLWIGRNLFIFFQRLLGAENLPQRFKDEHSFRHLCGRDRSDSLWIDQICINQEDIGERGRQVQIMDRIYRNANIVIAWLGEEDSYSKAALYGLHGLASLKQDMADQARGLSPIHSDLAPLGLSGKLAYTAVYAFLKRSWFRRAWIVQEAVLAAKVVMWCGPLQFNFDVLALSCLFLWRSHWWAHIVNDVSSRQKTRFGPGVSRMLPASVLAKLAAQLALIDGPADLYETDPDIEHGFDPVYAVCQIWDKRIVLGKGKPVGTYDSDGAHGSQPTRYEEMFTSFRLLEATEPKDKVYAFLGLRPIDSGAAPLVPDYRKEKACQAVYTEAAMYVMKTAQTLDLLAYREDDSRGRDTLLPSWVPDLGKPSPNNPIQGVSLTPWSAAVDAPIHLALHGPHDQVLRLNGLYVDDVSKSATWKWGDVSRIEELLAELSGLYAIYSQHKADDNAISTAASDAASSGSSRQAISPAPEQDQVGNCKDNLLLQTRTEVLWRTLIADCCQGQHPAPQQYGVAFADCLRHEIKMLESAILYDPRPKKSPPDEPNKSQLLMTAMSSYNSLAQYELDDLAAWNKVAELLDTHHEGRDLGASSPLERPLRESSPPEPLLRPFSGIFFGPSDADAAASGIKLADDPWTSDAQRNQASNEFQLRSAQMLDHRALFTTKDERFLGLGPRSLQKGDQVWLLAGAKVPHVLRSKENGKFELVGECYVHGIMHGEAARGRENDFVRVEIE